MSANRRIVHSRPRRFLRYPGGGLPAGRQMQGLVLLCVTALFFGSAPTFARLAFDGGTDAVSLQVFRFAITGTATFAAAALTRHLPRLARGQLVRLCLLALCTALSSYCYMTAVRYIPVAVASLTFFTFPLIVAPLSHFLRLDLLTMRKGVASVVAFAGLCLVLGVDLDLDWYGVALAFLAGVSVAASFVISRPLTQTLPALTITAFATGLPCLISIAAGLAADAIVFPPTLTGTLGVIANSLCFAIGLACLYAALARLGPLRTAVLINIEPLVSIAAAFVVLGQAISPVQMAGALIVVCGICLMQSGRPARPRLDAPPA